MASLSDENLLAVGRICAVVNLFTFSLNSLGHWSTIAAFKAFKIYSQNVIEIETTSKFYFDFLYETSSEPYHKDKSIGE